MRCCVWTFERSCKAEDAGVGGLSWERPKESCSGTLCEAIGVETWCDGEKEELDQF